MSDAAPVTVSCWAVAGGAIAVVVIIEAIGLGHQRALLPVLLGVPVAGALGLLVRSLVERSRMRTEHDPADDEIDNGPAETLRQWHARTQMLARHADGSRADWDRHLRPLLAKEFEQCSGHRSDKNRRAAEAAGTLLFGTHLWQWVDPMNAATRDHDTRAPGRAALDEILRRLQSV